MQEQQPQVMPTSPLEGCFAASLSAAIAFFCSSSRAAVCPGNWLPGTSMQEQQPPKWQKNDLVSGGHGRAAKLGACVNWVDWLRTSADKRMLSGRRAVVMVR